MAFPLAIVEAPLARAFIALDCKAAISVGFSATAHGQLSRNLTVRNSGNEHQLGQKLFREGIGARRIFLHQSLLSHGCKRWRKFPVRRPQIEWCLVIGNDAIALAWMTYLSFRLYPNIGSRPV